MAKKDSKQNKITTATSHVRNIRISPRKMRLVTNLVKGMFAYDAITQLEFTNKKGARFVIDMLRSAMANGENNFDLKKENLYIKTITCDAGPKIKRYMPRAQGRASEIRRPLAHIHVLLEERVITKKRRARFAEVQKDKDTSKQSTAPTTAGDEAEKQDAPRLTTQVTKTDEQLKRNKVQNKRRLFNRKSGV